MYTILLLTTIQYVVTPSFLFLTSVLTLGIHTTEGANNKTKKTKKTKTKKKKQQQITALISEYRCVIIVCVIIINASIYCLRPKFEFTSTPASGGSDCHEIVISMLTGLVYLLDYTCV